MLNSQALCDSAADNEVRDFSRFAFEDPSPRLRLSVEGEILYANKSSAPLLAVWDCVPGGKVPAAWRETIEAACESETSVEVEVVCDDQVFSCMLTPMIKSGYVNVYGCDVTERRRAETVNARFAAAVEQSSESVIITDPEGVIEYVNPGFERVTGYRREEVLGKIPGILESDRQDAAFYEELWRTVRSGCVWSGRLVNRRKNGELYEEDATVSPVFDASGEIVNLVAVSRDVSEKVGLERRLRQSQKLESVGTLASGIAHDFNNLLTAIIGYGQLAVEDAPAGSELERDLNQVLSAANRAKDLVRQILTFSRKSDEIRRPTELVPLIEDALGLLDATLPVTIETRVDIEKDCPPALADPTQVHQVIVNLCTNASHAMGRNGGTLDVGLNAVEVDAAFAQDHPGFRPGNYVHLTVADTGCGMDKATQERIFDPFFTTKAPGVGTGLGLAMVQGIVSAHNGAITVSSKPGKGTCFHVYFPSGRPAAIAMNGECGTGKRTFAAGNPPVLAEFPKRTLRRRDNEAKGAADRVENLETFRAGRRIHSERSFAHV